jgi:DNA-binding transcriptional ArsR family regulator
LADEKRVRKNSLEVSSQSLQDELVAIKDRLNAIETIQSISNAAVVKQYVEQHLATKDAKKIMAECEQPRTRSHLVDAFGYKSRQALDHHLKPLKEADLLRQKIEDDGTITYEWSNLFGRMPRSTIKSLLKETK